MIFIAVSSHPYHAMWKAVMAKLMLNACHSFGLG